MIEEGKIGKSIIVSGKVQGVFYRASTVEKARSLGVNGWVKNMPNGDVEINVFGDCEAVAELIVWCNQGPQFARVDLVNAMDIAWEDHKSFEVKY